MRRVALYGGPCDGQQSMASHQTAVSQGWIYVWDGGEDPDKFVYIDDVVGVLPEVERQAERQRVETWITANPESMEPVADIPDHRLNAWIQLIQNGL